MTQFFGGLAHHSLAHPYRPAVQVWSEPGYLTYRGLSRLVEVIDGRLRRAGVVADMAVAFDLPDALLTAVTLLATVRIGATLVSLEEAKILLCQRGSFASRPRRVIVDRSWFDVASDERCAPEASELFVARIDGLVLDWRSLTARAESTRCLFTEAAPILVCTENPASAEWLPVMLSALDCGRTLVFVAPDPGAIIQTALLYGATTAACSAELALSVAAIIELGEPVDLTFRQLLVQEMPTPEDKERLHRFLAREIFAFESAPS